MHHLPPPRDYIPCIHKHKCRNIISGCSFWHSPSQLNSNQLFDLCTDIDHAIKFLHIYYNPRLCREAQGMPCPDRTRCKRVHHTDLPTQDQEVSIIRDIIIECAGNYIDTYRASMITYFKEMTAACTRASEEFNWYNIVHNASVAGMIVLPDYVELMELIEYDESVARQRIVYGSTLYNYEYFFTYAKTLIKAKDKLQEDAVNYKRTVTAEYDATVQHFNELRKRLYIEFNFQIVRLLTSPCSVCEGGADDGITGLVTISQTPVCASCAIQYLSTIKECNIIPDVNMAPCVAPLSRMSNMYIHLPSLITTLLTMTLDHENLHKIINAQARITSISTKLAICYTRKETEEMCDAVDTRQRIIRRLVELMTLCCPNPACKHAFVDWNACSALTCTPDYGGQMEGFCGKQFCGICGKPSTDDEDIHDHVASCIRNFVDELIRRGIIPPNTDAGPTYFITEEIKGKILLLRKVKAIRDAAKDLTPDIRAWALAEMGRLHPELLTRGYGFIE